MEYRDSQATVGNEFQNHCIMKLAEQYRTDPSLADESDFTLLKFARATIGKAWPVIVYQGQDGEGFHILSITPTPTSNILSCAMCADRNTLSHIGEDATAQTGTLVNGICGAAVSHLIGGKMFKIEPFVLVLALPIGESALVKMTMPKSNRNQGIIRMEGYIESSMEPFFRPAKVYLSEIPTV